MKSFISNCGYERVSIKIKHKERKFSVHRLVAIAFIPNPENKSQVNHIDGNKLNNNASNLEWNTASENNFNKYVTCLGIGRHGLKSHYSKYKKKDIITACEMMESGIYTYKEISLYTGINIGMLYRIQTRKSWIDISIAYDVENCKSNKNKKSYTPEQYEIAFKLFEDNELSIYDIGDKSGIRYNTLINILNGSFKSKFGYLYEMYDISKYSTNHPLPDFSDEAKKLIDCEINRCTKTTVIINLIHDKYGYNPDRIRHYIHFLKHNKK